MFLPGIYVNHLIRKSNRLEHFFLDVYINMWVRQIETAFKAMPGPIIHHISEKLGYDGVQGPIPPRARGVLPSLYVPHQSALSETLDYSVRIS